MHATILTFILTVINTLPFFPSNTVVVALNENILSPLHPPPPPPSKPNEFSPNHSSLSWNPSMVTVIICLIIAFCVIGFVSVYIHKCSEQRFMNDLVADHDDNNDVETDNTISRRRQRTHRRRLFDRGIDPAIIDTFPVFIYSEVKGLKLGNNKGSLECAVCLNAFEDNDILRLLPPCSHVFHPDCIDAWLASHVTCPVCRADLFLVSLPERGEEITISDSLRHHLWSQPVTLSHETIDTEMIINNISPSQTVTEKFHGSHSAGHDLLLVKPVEDCERFTLRLPDEVMKSELSRARSWVDCPRVQSLRIGGHRSKSSSEIGRGRWVHGFPRGSSTRSLSKNEVEWEEEEETVGSLRNNSLFRSVKSPFDRLFGNHHHHDVEKEINGGERSFNRLTGESSV